MLIIVVIFGIRRQKSNLVENRFTNTIRATEINFDDGIDPEMLVKVDTFALQIYLQHFLLSHSSGGEHFSYIYRDAMKIKKRNEFDALIPEVNLFTLPKFTPDLSPHDYMNQVMRKLKRIPDEAWQNEFFIPWLHDLILSQNLFSRTEFDENQTDKRPDPCLVIKSNKKSRGAKDTYSRAFLAAFQPDIDPEQVSIEIRRFLRFLHQQLSKSRILNILTGYHINLTRKTKTQMEIDVFCLATPLQLGVHTIIQSYVRDFSPNRLYTLHLGAPLPGLSPLENYVANPNRTNDPPILITQNTLPPVENESIDQVVNMDRYNEI